MERLAKFKEDEYSTLEKKMRIKKEKYEKELEKLRNGFEGNQQQAMEDMKLEFEKVKQKMTEDFQVQGMVAKAKADQRMSELRFDYEKLLRAKEQAIQSTIQDYKMQIDKLQEELAQRNVTMNEMKDTYEAVLATI